MARYPHKNKHKNLCLSLVNNTPRPDRSCRYSHDMKSIRARQQRNSEREPCQHGAHCVFLMTDNCRYRHTQEEHASMLALRQERVAAVTSGLTDLETLAVPLQRLDDDLVTIAGTRELASFNKVADGEIAVPGCPPRFTPLTQSLHLNRDRDNKAISFTSAKYAHSFEPLLRAVELMQPAFDLLHGTDIISNAGNLRKLFDLLRNTKWTADRYDVEMHGETMLLSRWNEDPTLSFSLGHGAGFERATCQYPSDEHPLLSGSASHHRVVTYRLGGLQCVVQSEADAYYCDCDHSNHPFPVPSTGPKTSSMTTTPQKRHSDPFPRSQKRNSAKLRTRRAVPTTTAFAALTLDDPGDTPSFTAAASHMHTATYPPISTPTTTTTASPTLQVHHIGRPVPAPCLIEIKTRNARSVPLTTPEAQLYFARRARLYLAGHAGGVFAPGPGLAVQDKTGDLEGWEGEEQVQAGLGRLVRLLGLVRERVGVLKGEGVERVWLVCEGDGTGREKGVRVRLCGRERGEWDVGGDVESDSGGGGRLLPVRTGLEDVL